MVFELVGDLPKKIAFEFSCRFKIGQCSCRDALRKKTELIDLLLDCIVDCEGHKISERDI